MNKGNVSTPARNRGPYPVIVELFKISSIGGERRQGEIAWNRIVLLFLGGWLPYAHLSDGCWRCLDRRPGKFGQIGCARFAG